MIAFNTLHAGRELKYFGQELLIKAEATSGLTSKAYTDALANNRKYAGKLGIDAALAAGRLDALVAPTGGLAWLTDFVNGDNSGASFSSPAAVAGYPHITVPCGFVRGLPCGLSFVGPAWSDAALIGMAYAYEQASKRRRAPTYPKSVNPNAQCPVGFRYLYRYVIHSVTGNKDVHYKHFCLKKQMSKIKKWFF